MSWMVHIPVLVVVVPMLTALSIPLLRRLHKQAPWIAATLGCTASFSFAVTLLKRVIEEGTVHYRFGNWDPPWGIEYVIDHLNGFVMVVISFIFVMVAMYSKPSVDKEIDQKRQVVFYAIYMLLMTGLMGIVITGDIFNMYVFIEISSLASYSLIASGRNRNALTASFHYIILGTIGATFILLGIGHLYVATGTLNMADLSQRLPELYHSGTVLTAFAFFTVGLSIKLALFPLHVWMPNAYTHAPSAVSAVLAATSTKVAAYALLRILFTVFRRRFDLEVVPVTSILLVLSCVAIILGSVLAIAQTNLKRMLAYSSVGQIGYIVLGVALINKTALAGAILHILNHALMKGALFLVAGSIIYRTGVEDIKGLRGLGRKMPWTIGAFTVAGLSMVGVPLTVGFVSKWYLVVGSLEAGHWYVLPVIVVSSLLTVVYFWRLIESAYFNKPAPRAAGETEIREAPLIMVAPTVAVAGFCILFGIGAMAPARIAFKAAAMLLGGGE